MKHNKSEIKWQEEIFTNKKLWGKIIAIHEDRIVASADSYTSLNKKIKNISGCRFFCVPKNLDRIRILTLKIKSIKKHNWIPTYFVTFHGVNKKQYVEEMLIDSGADISVINHHFGKQIGLKTTPNEMLLTAEGIGGVINYYLREIEIEINGHKFLVPVAWLVDDKINDMIIGREVIFDIFNIEFRQSEEKIIFKKV